VTVGHFSVAMGVCSSFFGEAIAITALVGEEDFFGEATC
jgi:hypothetical protein